MKIKTITLRAILVCAMIIIAHNGLDLSASAETTQNPTSTQRKKPKANTAKKTNAKTAKKPAAKAKTQVKAPTVALPESCDSLKNYFLYYKRTDQKLRSTKLDNFSVSHANKYIKVVVSGGFEEQFYTPEVVDTIYAQAKKCLPDSLRNYRMEIFTMKEPIENFIPNHFRKGAKNPYKIRDFAYEGKPWVKNISTPLTIDGGLNNSHLVVWQSHGIYYKNEKDAWYWQRSKLYSTIEDLFSQTFVVPFLIPMIENAGGIVYTPRERDWQNHESIVDNDYPNKQGTYSEISLSAESPWKTTDQPGFAYNKDVYFLHDQPFKDGTARYVHTTSSENEISLASWTPRIEEAGRYAVYVSYQTLEHSVDDAHYTVFHKGGKTEFEVNQQMGGGTWVYLGTFEFDAGMNSNGRVVLTNFNKQNGVISADAVRFGGGMGNISRNNDADSITVSGYPRWAEAARYYAQWAGMPDSVFDKKAGTHDYNSDLYVRPLTANYLCGGSVYLPEEQGLKVPIEMAVAFHTDAGYSKDNDFVGSLTICTTDSLINSNSYDMASMFLANLSRDLGKYNWKTRQVLNRNYCETREPKMPSCILEMLSHQNFEDLKLAYDPEFRFNFARSMYKTILEYVSATHDRKYVVQPLPVKNFSVITDGKNSEAHLSWQAVSDPLEPSATPKHYILYTRRGNTSFDNGRIVKSTACKIKLTPGLLYSFKIVAVNEGGKSFPSETLCACANPEGRSVMVVNAFNRLEGPATIFDDANQGFDITTDPGVQYDRFAGFAGQQVSFAKSEFDSNTSSITGYSGTEIAGTVVAGNTFDYPFVHSKAILASQKCNISSISEDALNANSVSFSDYDMVDMIYGVQKNFRNSTKEKINNYINHGGRLFVSGSHPGAFASIPGVENNSSMTDSLYAYRQLDSLFVSADTLSFYREMNEYSYSVPSPAVLTPSEGATPFVSYNCGECAGLYKKGEKTSTVALGFPFETVKTENERERLMNNILNIFFNDLATDDKEGN